MGLKDNKRITGGQNWRPEWCSDAPSPVFHINSRSLVGNLQWRFTRRRSLMVIIPKAGVSRYKTARAPTEL